MLLSLALLFLVGMACGKLFEKIGIPSLLGMLLSGMLLGPRALGLLDGTLLSISAELRQIALIIILTRAGLGLDVHDLKKVGRPALLMCFVPATLEIAGMMLLAPRLLGVGLLDAVILGTVVAAVSPAVVVPRMLRLMESGFGRRKGIPQMIMAGASVDDVYVIVLFTAFTGLARGGSITPAVFLDIPVAIVLGLAGGIAAGLVLSRLFARFHIRDTGKVLIILSIAFLLVAAEHALQAVVGFSGLLAVMAMGAALRQKRHEVSKRLSGKFSKLWVGAEVLLFVLVGATVNIEYAAREGVAALLLVVGVMLFRQAGVLLSLTGTALNRRERLFCCMAYMPKATVQAAIGGLPLAMGLAAGDTILTVAVLSILVTAPLGAVLMDRTCKLLLTRDDGTTPAPVEAPSGAVKERT